MPIPFDRSDFLWGQAGLPGTGLTASEKDIINQRLSDLEALTPPTVLSDLNDVEVTTPSDNQLLRYVAANSRFENYTPAGTTYTFGIPFVIDGGGSAITSGVKYQGIEIPFAATIIGWTVTATASGNLVCTVSKATYANHPTYTAISGTEKPTLSSASKAQDSSLSTWTTALVAGDLLQLAVDSLATVNYATVNLQVQRTI
jgi:hypothetical protein